MLRIKIFILCGFFLLSLTPLFSDFFAKLPEFNPGDHEVNYEVFQPPWYPFDEEELKNYTVDERGQLTDSDGDQKLLEYGRKKTKSEAIKYELKKISQKIIFDKVITTPKTVVWDFYMHADFLKFDLPTTQGFLTSSLGSNIFEYGGYPPIPGDNRYLYDAWVFGLMCGWDYNRASGAGSLFGGAMTDGANWKGVLVPNLREFSVFLITQGVATAKHAILLLERDLNKKKVFNPGYATLKALSGHDYGFNAGKWQTEFIQPIWSSKKKKKKNNFDDWNQTVASLVMGDLTSKRVPAKNAFHRLRDIPELSEPIFLDLIKQDKTNLLIKRNLASILGGFSSKRSAQALHKLARDQDTVTALRALNSLAQHPHGRVRQLLINWLNKDTDELRRAKAILMIGRSNDPQLTQKLLKFWPQAVDDMERELIVRSLMRLKCQDALEMFQENLKHSFEQLAYSSQLGLMMLGQLKEHQVMKLIDEAFYREDAVPGSGKVVSYSPKYRFDLVNYIAHSEMKKPRRRLWKYIRELKKMPEGSEAGGVPHLLAYGLYEMELGDHIIDKKEAIKVLTLLASRSSTNAQIRIAALSRLYELDQSKCLKVCDTVIERFLKGRRVGEADNGTFEITEKDFLAAAINLSLIDGTGKDDFIVDLMTSVNIDEQNKTILLEKIFEINKKKAIKIVKKSLKKYTSKQGLNRSEERYLVKLIRLASVLDDPTVLGQLINIIDKHSNDWVRFMSLYSLRLSLDMDVYANVIDGQSHERGQLVKILKKALRNRAKP